MKATLILILVCIFITARCELLPQLRWSNPRAIAHNITINSTLVTKYVPYSNVGIIAWINNDSNIGIYLLPENITYIISDKHYLTLDFIILDNEPKTAILVTIATDGLHIYQSANYVDWNIIYSLPIDYSNINISQIKGASNGIDNIIFVWYADTINTLKCDIEDNLVSNCHLYNNNYGKNPSVVSYNNTYLLFFRYHNDTHPNSSFDGVSVFEENKWSNFTIIYIPGYIKDYNIPAFVHGESIFAIAYNNALFKANNINSNWRYKLNLVDVPLSLQKSYVNNMSRIVIMGSLNGISMIESFDYGENWNQTTIVDDNITSSISSLTTNNIDSWIYAFIYNNTIYVIETFRDYYPVICRGYECTIDIDLYVTEETQKIEGNLTITNHTTIFIESGTIEITGNLTFLQQSKIQIKNITKPITISGCLNMKGTLSLDTKSFKQSPSNVTIFTFPCSIGQFDSIEYTNTEEGICYDVAYTSVSLFFLSSPCNSTTDTPELFTMIISVSICVFVTIVVALSALYIFRYKIFPYRIIADQKRATKNKTIPS